MLHPNLIDLEETNWIASCEMQIRYFIILRTNQLDLDLDYTIDYIEIIPHAPDLWNIINKTVRIL